MNNNLPSNDEIRAGMDAAEQIITRELAALGVEVDLAELWPTVSPYRRYTTDRLAQRARSLADEDPLVRGVLLRHELRLGGMYRVGFECAYEVGHADGLAGRP